MAITIGDQWRHLNGSDPVAMCRLKCPTKGDVTNGDNGTIGANGANDDPFETMMIHWSYNCSNGDNGSNDDNGFNGDNGNNNPNDDSGYIGANGDTDDP
jgi:hypothetical protein